MNIKWADRNPIRYQKGIIYAYISLLLLKGGKHSGNKCINKLRFTSRLRLRNTWLLMGYIPLSCIGYTQLSAKQIKFELLKYMLFNYSSISTPPDVMVNLP
jgi:hypothetical protein